MFGRHNNRIGDKIGNYCNLSTGFNLQIFGTSFNKIKELREDTLLSGLKNIYLNNKPQFNNRLEFSNKPQFSSKPQFNSNFQFNSKFQFPVPFLTKHC